MHEEREQVVSEAVPTDQASSLGESPEVHQPAGVLAQQSRQPLSARQIRAIYDAMRTFRDDDISRSGGKTIVNCDRCGCSRSAAGSLVYGSLRLCNGCATDYELLRASGMERDIVIFAHEPPPSTSRPDATLEN